MRIHIGVKMGDGRLSQTAIVAVNHRLLAADEPGGEQEFDHIVGHIEQIPPTLDAAVDRVLALVARENTRPCIFIDTTTAPGKALLDTLRTERGRGRYPKQVPAGDVHTPHDFPIIGRDRQGLMARIQRAYATDRLHFTDGLALRGVLERALERDAEDPLVVALGMALWSPLHGTFPEYRERSGEIRIHPAATTEPY